MELFIINEEILSMSETEIQQPTPETNQTMPDLTPQAQQEPKKSLTSLYIGSVIIVLLIVVGVLYLLESQGRSSTNFFGSVTSGQTSNVVVATVNGETITEADLSTSIGQFNQVAVAQGIDTTAPDVIAEIESQALNVLINTTLLKQEATDRGLSVSDETVNERLETIQTELGGEEILAARMVELGIDNDRLVSDVRDEILIQQLLDEVFADNEITASEEEIAALYSSAGGEDAGLPPIEEVTDQVEAEVIAAKEQEVIDAFLETLKTDAEINIAAE